MRESLWPVGPVEYPVRAPGTGFRLVTTMKRGTVPGLREAWCVYPSLEDARTGGKKLSLHERVARVMIVTAQAPPSFVEWL